MLSLFQSKTTYYYCSLFRLFGLCNHNVDRISSSVGYICRYHSEILIHYTIDLRNECYSRQNCPHNHSLHRRPKKTVCIHHLYNTIGLHMFCYSQWTLWINDIVYFKKMLQKLEFRYIMSNLVKNYS